MNKVNGNNLRVNTDFTLNAQIEGNHIGCPS